MVDMLQLDDISVPDQIQQTYRVVPTEDITLAVWKSIQLAQSHAGNEPAKIVLIFLTGRIAAYYAEACRRSGLALEVFEIHARLKQDKRTHQSEAFREASSGILFTSDVSSRGLDYPGVKLRCSHATSGRAFTSSSSFVGVPTPLAVVAGPCV